MNKIDFLNLENISPEDLAESLASLNLAPKIHIDQNPYSGTMKIIRTTVSPVGARYIHAQFFEDTEGGDFLQHFSFELAPSDSAFDDAKKFMQEKYKISKPPTYISDSYVSWDLGEYTVWIKELKKDDLPQSDPFNSYSPEDEGTIRVAIEFNIHHAN